MLSRFFVFIALSASLSASSARAFETTCGAAKVAGVVAVPLSIGLGLPHLILTGLYESIHDPLDYFLSDYTEEEKENYDWYHVTDKKVDLLNPEIAYNKETKPYCASEEKDKPIEETSVKVATQTPSLDNAQSASAGE